MAFALRTSGDPIFHFLRELEAFFWRPSFWNTVKMKGNCKSTLQRMACIFLFFSSKWASIENQNISERIKYFMLILLEKYIPRAKETVPYVFSLMEIRFSVCPLPNLRHGRIENFKNGQNGQIKAKMVKMVKDRLLSNCPQAVDMCLGGWSTPILWPRTAVGHSKTDVDRFWAHSRRPKAAIEALL